MPTAIHRHVELARAGELPRVIARMSSGWAVMGEKQVLPGYSLLLPDPVVPDLNSLGAEDRSRFLYEASVVGVVSTSSTCLVFIFSSLVSLFSSVSAALRESFRALSSSFALLSDEAPAPSGSEIFLCLTLPLAAKRPVRILSHRH